MANLLLSAHYRRVLSPSECTNPISPSCAMCSLIDLKLGVCSALAETSNGKNLGLITAWGMFFCFLIPIVGVATRRTKIFWAGLAPIIAIICAAIFQETIPSPRPLGACMGEGTSCGMPSGHVITSYATITFLMCMWGRDLVLEGFRECIGRICTVFGFLLFIIVGVFFMIQVLMPVGRVLLFYHTEAQVGFGVLAGSFIGLTWFFLVAKYIGPNVGPVMERKMTCITVHDDWNSVGRHVEVLSNHNTTSLMSSTFAQGDSKV